MIVLLRKMARPAFALCLLVLGSYPVNGAERLKVFTSAVPRSPRRTRYGRDMPWNWSRPSCTR